MRILYGIQLNGNGHITRASEIIEQLNQIGCSVDIIASGNNSNLSLAHPIKEKFKGLSLYYNSKGTIDWLSSIKDVNPYELIKDTNYDVSKYDLVISDFEPISAWSAHRSGVKSINISNQNSLLFKSTPKFNRDVIAEFFLKYFAYSQNRIGIHYQQYDNQIFQPIVPKSILTNPYETKDFISVYLPAYNLKYLTESFKRHKSKKWVIFSKEVDNYYYDQNVKVFPLSLINFQEHLKKCYGVITASGFSTTSEALVLGKKLWSIPIKKQYEQICNSKALKDMGIFVEDLDYSNIQKWIEEYESINYDWKNPITSIMDKIFEIYES